MTDGEKDSMQMALDELKDFIEPLVKKIEASFQMTQDHYGEYMNILSRSDNSGQQKMVALALVKFGANPKGVLAACKILGLF